MFILNGNVNIGTLFLTFLLKSEQFQRTYRSNVNNSSAGKKEPLFKKKTILRKKIFDLLQDF